MPFSEFMDGCSRKKAMEGRQPSSKKGVSLVLRDRFNGSGYRNVPICRNPMKGKEKSLLSSSSSNGKEIIGSCSKSRYSLSSSIKSEKKAMSQTAMDSSESNSDSEEEAETQISAEAECSDMTARKRSNTIAQHGLRNRNSRSILLSFGLEKKFNGRVETNKTRSFRESGSSSSTKGKNIIETSKESSNSDTRRARDSNSVGTRRLARSSCRNGLASITSSYPRGSPASLELFRNCPESELSGSLMTQDSFHGYNLDGISEILPELDRIQRDIELNYEGLVVMETGLRLGDLRFYDQHRDMRLDIDNMSYEQLLALEERIGSVSTALSEEAIAKCIRKKIYQITAADDISLCCNNNDDDRKCSICQEEYREGESVGRLQCEHMYHVGCVQEWLRLKNWCPICKASAEPSSSSSSTSSSSSSSPF